MNGTPMLVICIVEGNRLIMTFQDWATEIRDLVNKKISDQPETII